MVTCLNTKKFEQDEVNAGSHTVDTRSLSEFEKNLRLTFGLTNDSGKKRLNPRS